MSSFLLTIHCEGDTITCASAIVLAPSVTPGEKEMMLAVERHNHLLLEESLVEQGFPRYCILHKWQK